MEKVRGLAAPPPRLTRLGQGMVLGALGALLLVLAAALLWLAG